MDAAARAISLALVVGLILFLESRDQSSIDSGESHSSVSR